MPDLLDRFDLEPEGVGECLLREPGVDPDPQRAGRELEQANRPDESRWSSIARQHARRFEAGRRAQPVDRVGDADRRVVGSGSSRAEVGQSSATVSAMSPT